MKQIYYILSPQKDIISLLPEELSLNILSFLDFKTLVIASMV